jgi:NADPH2:quinone reductase
MQAAEYSRFGPPDVLEVVERPVPTPRAGEVLIRVHATTVTSAECHMRRGRPLWGRVILGFRRPRRRMRRLGLEFAGEVVEVGSGVTRCAPGDQIFGFTGFRLGAAAQYLLLPQSASFAPKPAGVPFGRAAAAVDGATTALYFLQGKAHVQTGQRVLVIGASGSVGSFAVQLAHRFGAEVTGVCSGRNAELVRSLGAAHVVDHTREDFTTTGERYDVIFDAAGRSSFGRSRGSLTAHGCYMSTATGPLSTVLALATRLGRGRRVLSGMSVQKNAALTFVAGLLADDALEVVICRVHDLAEIVEAHEYVESGRKVGNVVVAVLADAS